MKTQNTISCVITHNKKINASTDFVVPENICSLLSQWGQYCQNYHRDRNVWILDNIKFVFDDDMHLSIFVNDRFVQGYKNIESITNMLTEHVRINTCYQE